jgi:hypothetical protein
VTAPALLVGETEDGDLYELRVVTRITTSGPPGPPRVSLGLALDDGVAAVSLTLTPDEARALAADLRRWAGHAERDGRR